MVRARDLSFTILVALALCAGSLLADTAQALSFQCPDGQMSHPATPMEARSVTNGTIVAGVTQVCPGDARLGISNDAGSAKEFLNSLPKRPMSNCAPPTRENIDSLNGTFAICAANFLRAYQAYGGVAITSAFRDGTTGTAGDGSGRSANQCAGGAGASNHTRGVAMDVNPLNGSYEQLWAFSMQNPQFGICFPHQNGQPPNTTGYADRPHMILAGIGGNEAAACARQGITRPCNGLPFTPSPPAPGPGTSPFPPTSAPTPSSPLTSALRTMFGMPAAPMMYPPMTAMPAPSPATIPAAQTGMPTACLPKFFCSGNTYYYQTSSCSFQTIETCPNGCNGDVCAASSTSKTISSMVNNDTISKNPNLVDDLLKAIANPVSATSVSIGRIVPIGLNEDLLNIIDENRKSTSSASQTYATGTIAYVQPTYSQTTFTSADLSLSPSAQQPARMQSQSTFQAVLTSLKVALLKILTILQPFGNRTTQVPHID